MNAVRTFTSDLSHEARNVQWLLQNFVEEVPGVHSIAVVSSDGLLLLSSQTEPADELPDEPATAPVAGSAAEPSTGPIPGPIPGRTVPPQGGGPRRPSAESQMDLAAVVSGVASLTFGAARLMDGGKVRQTTVAMADGMLFVTAISDGSLLGVHAGADADISVIGYHMALFVGRVGHVLTPALRTELRHVMESAH
ncbi:hypothetical protein GA0115240_13545 [Streptomyces sp. DvalAA-14]|uniref:roadblock/LC7 domain-containing protein n=1 Tax=unclassified Streptomyces TaxID=2593676 RepID=UPI00081B083C|nr:MULTISPECIES: roadblock/LC7 domain-containing protein [unclassified Streptomyces]MYS21889.1 roadblock/LC7 domain-containing protein [Streptomyces sp. SID4948]SCE03354.1 hypothetical protein GA0115240_13545 [Streptomyces sp. DvalAA-14]